MVSTNAPDAPVEILAGGAEHSSGKTSASAGADQNHSTQGGTETTNEKQQHRTNNNNPDAGATSLPSVLGAPAPGVGTVAGLQQIEQLRNRTAMQITWLGPLQPQPQPLEREESISRRRMRPSCSNSRLGWVGRSSSGPPF